jgi:hypothetical protein
VAAAALKAACDFVVPLDTFIEEALGIQEERALPLGLGEQPIAQWVPPTTPIAPAVQIDVVKLKEDVKNYVRAELVNSSVPILQSALGLKIPREVGKSVRETNWCGHRSLTRLLQDIENSCGFVYVFDEERSFIYDPTRHTALRSQDFSGDFVDLSPELAEFIERMNKSIGLPRLRPLDYQLVAKLIAQELQSGVTGNLAISGRVRDACQASGHAVGRSSINFILTGIDFTHQPENGSDIARAFRDYALNLAKNAQLALTDQELKMLDQWLLDGEPEAREAQGPGRQAPDDMTDAAPQGHQAEPGEPS